LPVAVAQIEEAADACGINRLDWLPTQQAAAQSLTWPVGRGLHPPKTHKSSQVLDWIASAAAGKEH